MDPTAARWRIGEHRFDATTGEIEGPAGSTRLAPKAARLLALLLERPGELVPRERLRQELWPEQHVEIDQVLAYTVRQVRAALGDDGAEPRFVETLPRRGYRLLVPAESVNGGSAVVAPDTVAPSVAPVDRVRRGWPLVAAFAFLVLLGVGGWAWRRGGERAAATPRTTVRVALLPLGAPGETVDDPLTDALTDALVVALTAQPTLAVVGPATTAGLRGTLRPHTEIGRELGVAFVASGGYRVDERFLFVQLVRVADGKHVFAQRYRGSPAEVQRQLGHAGEELAAAAAASTSTGR
jgi:DNA-binding winged helix-turn-helix (wHTH) protein/TolB-like protein